MFKSAGVPLFTKEVDVQQYPRVWQHSFVEIEHENIFLRSFFPCCWFKKGICQFLAKECTQRLINQLED